MYGYNERRNNFGCRSTPKALKYMLSNNNEIAYSLDNHDFHKPVLKRMLKKSDVVFINGEGTPIFTPTGRTSLNNHIAIIEQALNKNKKCYYLNTMISECPVRGLDEDILNRVKELWSKCDMITVRDKRSFEFVKDMPNAKYVPDALFSWYENDVLYRDRCINLNKKFRFPFNNNYICISGSSYPYNYTKKHISGNKNGMKNLIKRLMKLEKDIVLISTAKQDNWLSNIAKEFNLLFVDSNIPIRLGYSILKNSDLLISGRFHPSIMASIGGTPCIFMNSNSHKTESLQTELEYDNVKIFNGSNLDVDMIYEMSVHYLDNLDHYNEKIKGTVKKLCDVTRSFYENLVL